MKSRSITSLLSKLAVTVSLLAAVSATLIEEEEWLPPQHEHQQRESMVASRLLRRPHPHPRLEHTGNDSSTTTDTVVMPHRPHSHAHARPFKIQEEALQQQTESLAMHAEVRQASSNNVFGAQQQRDLMKKQENKYDALDEDADFWDRLLANHGPDANRDLQSLSLGLPPVRTPSPTISNQLVVPTEAPVPTGTPPTTPSLPVTPAPVPVVSTPAPVPVSTTPAPVPGPVLTLAPVSATTSAPTISSAVDTGVPTPIAVETMDPTMEVGVDPPTGTAPTAPVSAPTAPTAPVTAPSAPTAPTVGSPTSPQEPTGAVPTAPVAAPTGTTPTAPVSPPVGTGPPPTGGGGMGETWTEQVLLSGSMASDRFGWDVSFNNDASLLAVGAYFSDANGQDSGMVDVYRIAYADDGTATSSQVASIEGSEPGGFLGISVDLSGDGNLLLASGTMNVELYQKGADDSYTLLQDFDPNSEGNDFPGTYNGVISKDGSTIAISSRNANGQAGAVRVWRDNDGTWTQVGQDITGTAAGDLLGFALSIDETGETLATAALRGSEARGYARIFALEGEEWTQMGTDLQGDTPGDYFGRSIDIATIAGVKVVAIGAYQCPSCNPAGSGPGRVEVFSFDGSDWMQMGGSIEGPQDGAQFGVSVALAPSSEGVGAMVIAGANGYDGEFTANGLVQAYSPSSDTGEWMVVGQPITGGADGKNLGVSVTSSTTGNVLAAGGPLDSSVSRPGIGDALVYRLL